ncbi:BTAD domain-containing putative transcriptional regulator [Glycomyces endophyticus]|uniref:BTAD domain-containing putative transcriptional regulator n=1 Tax=Glycomyces endophyticus TaxID=480996 RepID=A0ABN2HJU3_9ACTN
MRAGLKQQQLADKSGVAVRTIGRYETRAKSVPKPDTVALLAEALDLTPRQYAELSAAAGFPAQEAEPRPRASRVPHRHGDRLVEAAAQLADEVGSRWRREEEQRKVHSAALPVRWRTSEELSDHWENVDPARAEPMDLDADLEQIVDVYRGVPTGRLVVVGRAGSGKTVLAMRLVLGLLEIRETDGAVPVVVGLESWHPDQDFRTWLAARLLRDHPGLGEELPDGTALAAALVEHGLVLPVLDGFDEIAAGLRSDALGRLDDASRMPLVLTSRADEYREAATAVKPLTGAPCIELADLAPADLAGYLRRTARKTAQGVPLWQPVIDAMREPRTPAGETAAAVLATPLMLVLARTVYGGTANRDPAELLSTADLPTPEAVEAHLMAQLVPAAYRTPIEGRGFDPARARHWLGRLARHLDRLGRHDLAWWELGASLPRGVRALLMALTIGALFTAVDLALVVVRFGFDPLTALATVAVDFGAGAAFGVAHGLLAGRRDTALAPSGMRISLRGPWRRRNLKRRFMIGFAGGFLLGAVSIGVRDIVQGIVYGAGPFDVSALVAFDVPAFGAAVGLATGITYAMLSLWERPLDFQSVPSPADLLKASRRTALAQALVFAPVLAVVVPGTGWAVVQVLQLLPLGEWRWTFEFGLTVGSYAAFMGSVGYAIALTAWGRWLVFGRLWLPLLGRLPWAVPAFLDDAYRRGVLRRAGVVYQFRHARLQSHLSGTRDDQA